MLLGRSLGQTGRGMLQPRQKSIPGMGPARVQSRERANSLVTTTLPQQGWTRTSISLSGHARCKTAQSHSAARRGMRSRCHPGCVIEYFWIEPFSGIEIMTAHQTAWRTTAPSRPARPWPDATLRASAGAPAAPRLRSDVFAPGLHSVSPALRAGLPRHRAFPLLRARRQADGRLAARPGSQQN